MDTNGDIGNMSHVGHLPSLVVRRTPEFVQGLRTRQVLCSDRQMSRKCPSVDFFNEEDGPGFSRLRPTLKSVRRQSSNVFEKIRSVCRERESP